jgi:hypothetical protein
VDQFVDGKFKHQSSLTYIKSIEGTLRSLGKTISDFQCPTDLLLLPLTANQVRFKDPTSGKWFIYDRTTGSTQPQVPEGFDWKCVPAITFMMDQGSINIKAVHHMMTSMLIMCVAYYVFSQGVE